MNDLMRGGTSIRVFKTLTLQWWQAGLFKWGMFALGIAVGAYWHVFFGGYLIVLIILAVASLTYIAYVWWKQ
jgi:hypothetical protein